MSDSAEGMRAVPPELGLRIEAVCRRFEACNSKGVSLKVLPTAEPAAVATTPHCCRPADPAGVQGVGPFPPRGPCLPRGRMNT